MHLRELVIYCLCVILVINRINCNEVFEEQFIELAEIQNQTCAPSFCKDSTAVSNYIIQFCKKQNSTIQSRCCINTHENNTIIIALDFTSCDIEKLSITVGSLKKDNVNNVQVLDVRNNSLTECGVLETFAGFVKLNELYFTDLKGPICDCPGGNFSWDSYGNGECIGRKDLCNSTFSPNLNCTKNSMCVENGPGNFLCECKSGFHGYKCLKQGEFPTLLFTLSICLSTVLLSGFLWQTQRRHVKKN